jgi:hypothetical protein
MVISPINNVSEEDVTTVVLELLWLLEIRMLGKNVCILGVAFGSVRKALDLQY